MEKRLCSVSAISYQIGALISYCWGFRSILLTDLHVSKKFLLAKNQLSSRFSLIVIINMAEENR